ncbi:MAG TPA: hypothetical protein VGB00_12910 [Pyrinomonadaceae bacterium]
MHGQTSSPKNENFNEAYKKFKVFYERELKQAGVAGSSLVFNTNIILLANTPLEKDAVGKLRQAVRRLHESVE